MIQPILCGGETVETDLCVFLNSEASSYDAYIGLALLERVSIDPGDLQHKMLVGRLCNHEVELCRLRAAFGHDNRTIKKWARALKSGDVEVMAKAFAGRGYRKKTSPELIRYARQLYRNRTRLNLGRNYRETIIAMIRDVFEVKISPSLASRIFLDTDKEACEPTGSGVEERAEEEATCGVSEGTLSSESGPSVYKSPTFPFLGFGFLLGSFGVLIRHAGLVLLGLWLRLYKGIERQMICQLLQGAVNVEQSKSLCHRSLSYFTQTPVKVLRQQREALDRESASVDNVLDLYARNALLLADGPNRGDVFYFDPHTKEYTGELDVLKGWCGRRHGIRKVVNLDCFHTRSGRPCFIQHYSSYYDMRERFFMSLALFDRLFDEDKRQGRTFIIDRGIYGLATLGRFWKDYVITWEKGFKQPLWDPEEPSLHFERYRTRNNAEDRQAYKFECRESVWKRNDRFRRIVVKATHPEGRTIVVSILCSHPTMDVQDVVWAIFNRWLQENDFKYLDVHFGINQLDSRASDSFRSQAESFQDRPIDSPEYQEAKSALKECEDQLAKRLLALHKEQAREKELQARIEVATAKMRASLAKRRKRLSWLQADEDSPMPKVPSDDEERRLDRDVARAVNDRERRQKRIRRLDAEIADLDARTEALSARLSEAIRKGSRIQLLIDGNYQLLDLRRKTYMDALRVNAANMFRNLVARFRPIYDNHRDDHERVRILTRCSGFLHRGAEGWHVQLWLPGTLQDHVVSRMQEFTDQVCVQVNEESDVNVQVELVTGPVQCLKTG